MKLRPLFVSFNAATVAIATLGACVHEPAGTPPVQPVSSEPRLKGPAEASEALPDESVVAIPPGASTAPPPAEVVPAEPASDEPLPAVEFETPHRLGARPFVPRPIQASAEDTVLGTWNIGGVTDPNFVTNRQSFHAATRVILDTRLLSGKKSLGRLSSGGILAQTRSQGYWPFRLCLEDALRAGTDERTTAVLRFSIDTRGKVSYAHMMRADASPTLAKCLRKAAYAPRYSPPPPRRVDVELTAQVAKGDVPLPPRDVPSEKSTGKSNAGESTAGKSNVQDSTVESFAALTPKVAQCYRAGLERDAGLWGRVALAVRCDERQPPRAEQFLSQFPDEAVTACIAELALTVAEADACDLVVAWRLGQRPVEEKAPSDATTSP